MFIVYILFSTKLNKYYIGFTSDSAENRIQKHLSDHKGYTSKAKDWKVVYSEEFENKSAALLREKEIKGWKSLVKIKELLQG